MVGLELNFADNRPQAFTELASCLRHHIAIRFNYLPETSLSFLTNVSEHTQVCSIVVSDHLELAIGLQGAVLRILFKPNVFVLYCMYFVYCICSVLCVLYL